MCPRLCWKLERSSEQKLSSGRRRQDKKLTNEICMCQIVINVMEKNKLRKEDVRFKIRELGKAPLKMVTWGNDRGGGEVVTP